MKKIVKPIVEILIMTILLVISINSIKKDIIVVRGYPQNGHIIIPLDPDIEWHGIKKWWIGQEYYTVNGVKVRITTEEFFDICNNHNGVKIRITDKEKFDKYNKK